MKTVEEIRKVADSLFEEDSGLRDRKIEVEETTKHGKQAVRITATAMYSAPKVKAESLVGLVELFKEVTGCENMDIEDEFGREGCDTCDYGSSYGKIYILW